MDPQLKLWIEQGGNLALSDYRVRLLQYVQETGSLARAATRMRLSYRRAWGKIKEIEQNLGVTLVTSEAGGTGGGHTRLTPAGEELVARYRSFRTRMEEALRREFAAAFEGTRALDAAAARPDPHPITTGATPRPS